MIIHFVKLFFGNELFWSLKLYIKVKRIPWEKLHAYKTSNYLVNFSTNTTQRQPILFIFGIMENLYMMGSNYFHIRSQQEKIYLNIEKLFLLFFLGKYRKYAHTIATFVLTKLPYICWLACMYFENDSETIVYFISGEKICALFSEVTKSRTLYIKIILKQTRLYIHPI